MKIEEFLIRFGIMAEYFGSQPSEGLAKVYFDAFKDWSISDFEKSCKFVMETRSFNSLPKISEIKEALYGKPQDMASLAYEKLKSAIRSVGSWRSVIFEDGALGRTIQAMGGWLAVCEITNEEWQFRRKEFNDIYTANLNQGSIEPLQLQGGFEIEGIKSGHGTIDEPVTIESDTKHIQNKKGLKILEIRN